MVMALRQTRAFSFCDKIYFSKEVYTVPGKKKIIVPHGDGSFVIDREKDFIMFTRNSWYIDINV